MSTPVSAAPAIDPKVIQQYRFVAVSTTGVRTVVDPGTTAHHTYAEAQTKATAIAAALGSTTAAIVEIWPPAPIR